MDIATRDLKDHLSKYLKRVQAGEELTITSHGKPIAKLSPPDRALMPRPDPLANVAWIRQPTRKRLPGETMGLGANKIVLSGEGPSLSQMMLDDRD